MSSEDTTAGAVRASGVVASVGHGQANTAVRASGVVAASGHGQANVTPTTTKRVSPPPGLIMAPKPSVAPPQGGKVTAAPPVQNTINATKAILKD
jgi:hypothetical protein